LYLLSLTLKPNGLLYSPDCINSPTNTLLSIAGYSNNFVRFSFGNFSSKSEYPKVVYLQQVSALQLKSYERLLPPIHYAVCKKGHSSRYPWYVDASILYSDQ
jgi:hypothetical protein